MSELIHPYIDTEILFGRYACPCIESRIADVLRHRPRGYRRTESEIAHDVQTLQELQKTILSGQAPSWEKLEEGFPKPIAEIAAFAQESGRDPKSFEVVSEWWRSHKGEGGQCAVRYERICHIQVGFYVMRGDTMCRLANPYNLTCQTNIFVYTHHLTIVEVPPYRTRHHTLCRPR